MIQITLSWGMGVGGSHSSVVILSQWENNVCACAVETSPRFARKSCPPWIMTKYFIVKKCTGCSIAYCMYYKRQSIPFYAQYIFWQWNLLAKVWDTDLFLCFRMTEQGWQVLHWDVQIQVRRSHLPLPHCTYFSMYIGHMYHSSGEGTHVSNGGAQVPEHALRDHGPLRHLHGQTRCRTHMPAYHLRKTYSLVGWKHCVVPCFHFTLFFWRTIHLPSPFSYCVVLIWCDTLETVCNPRLSLGAAIPGNGATH